MERELSGRAQDASSAPATRRRVLKALLESPTPLDAAAVAARVGLHVATARFHLEKLERAALVRRSTRRAGVRGRPQVVFVAGPSAREEGAQRDLNDALATALGQDPDGGRARAIRAGEGWSEHFDTELSAASADAGSDALLGVLDRLGFDAESVDDGHRIALRACPFRDEARRNPDVVCSVHLGLLRGAARSLGHGPDDLSLHPFVQPELCTVHLSGDWS